MTPPSTVRIVPVTPDHVRVGAARPRSYILRRNPSSRFDRPETRRQRLALDPAARLGCNRRYGRREGRR
jgi:hypothetical protein